MMGMLAIRNVRYSCTGVDFTAPLRYGRGHGIIFARCGFDAAPYGIPVQPTPSANTMGLFDFIKGIGKKVLPGREAEEIQSDIAEALGNQVQNLGVTFDDGTVTLTGTVDSQATREKVILLAGNVEDVEHVDDQLTVDTPEPEVIEEAPVFYTVQKGDYLSKIAKEVYGNANKWNALFEANREVIKDPDLIYPGQQIRIPKMEE